MVASGTAHAQVSGSGNIVNASEGVAPGIDANAGVNDSIAFGTNAIAASIGANAIGYEAKADSSGDTAFGSYSHADGRIQTKEIADFSSASGTPFPAATAVGQSAAAVGAGASAFGSGAQASGDATIAIGSEANSSGIGGVAMGTGSKALGAGSLAIGSFAQANNPGDVALGGGSSTAAAHTGVTGLYGVDVAGIPVANVGVVSVGSVGTERQIQNLAPGVISATSTDAVNGSQLNSVANGIYNLNAGMGGPLQQTDSVGNRLTLVARGRRGGDPGVAQQLSNVADGVAPTDAINVRQLNAAKDWSRSYTDQQFRVVDRRLNAIRNRADAGIASAIAMASLPQAYQPNQSSAAVALGTFNGQTGAAVGVSTISESGRWIYRLNGTANTRGDTGVGVGAAMTW
ncbi:YadA family autotransporter adhesin [Luteibacter rhizovicinus]|nr:YadA-like family protein [Luteibacter rhizovicinus]